MCVWCMCVYVCMYVCVCTRVDTWVPTAEARDGGAMSCLVSCGPGGWSRAGRARGGRQAGRAATAAAGGQGPGWRPCVLCIICWCECRKSGWWASSRPCLCCFGDTSLEIGACRALFWWALVPQPRWAEFSWRRVGFSCRCQLALRAMVCAARICSRRAKDGAHCLCFILLCGRRLCTMSSITRHSFINFAPRTPIMETWHPTRLDDLIYSRQIWYHSLPLSLFPFCLCPVYTRRQINYPTTDGNGETTVHPGCHLKTRL